MVNLAQAIIILEMLVVNIIITFLCSAKKRSWGISLLVLIVFTGLVFVLNSTVLVYLPGHGQGNGAYLLIGILYVIPFIYLFDQSIRHTLVIMSTAWIYTMLVVAFTMRIACLIEAPDYFNWVAVGIQTAGFLLTGKVYYNFIKNKFVYIIWNLDTKILNIIITSSFSFLLLLNLQIFSFVEGHTYIGMLFTLLLTGFVAFSIYKVLFLLVTAKLSEKSLEKKNKIDVLTGLRNRVGLMTDLESILAKGQSGTLAFIDLDNLKLVNDTLGHTSGDKYLVSFAKKVKKILNLKDIFYRLSGDEFVIIFDSDRAQSENMCRDLSLLSFGIDGLDLVFMGLSFGCVSFPEEGHDISILLSIADERMYQQKKEKHRTGYQEL